MYLRAFHKNVADMKNNLAVINFLTAKDGHIYEVRKNEIGLFSVKAEEIYELDKWQEGFQFSLPKIPNELIYQALSFFRKYCEFESIEQEVMVQVFWDRKKEEYFIYVPEQRVTPVSISLSRSSKLEEEHLLVMDIHSHNTMGAFFSSIDNKDEKETRLYAVIGRVDNNPEIKLRMGCGGKFLELHPLSIFENELDFNNNYSEYPLEWGRKVALLI